MCWKTRLKEAVSNDGTRPTARRLGVSPATVHLLVNDQYPSEPGPRVMEAIRKNLMEGGSNEQV